MIRSMTGYGRAEHEDGTVRIAVEVRTVNNRGLKISPRLPEGFLGAEIPIEKLVREHLTRGTVLLAVDLELRGEAARAPVDADVLAAYWKALAGAARDLGAPPPSIEGLVALPGVVDEAARPGADPEALQARVLATVGEALERLDAMRAAEGQATAEDMRAALAELSAGLATVQQRVPAVVEEYAKRLKERAETLMEGAELAADHQTLVREVAFFAERSDTSEECARLASHLAQFRELLASPGPAGRKFEFLAQEMYREVNTIGSKANDPDIGRAVVDMKLRVDRLREQAQNVE